MSPFITNPQILMATCLFSFLVQLCRQTTGATWELVKKTTGGHSDKDVNSWKRIHERQRKGTFCHPFLCLFKSLGFSFCRRPSSLLSKPIQSDAFCGKVSITYQQAKMCCRYCLSDCNRWFRASMILLYRFWSLWSIACDGWFLLDTNVRERVSEHVLT